MSAALKWWSRVAAAVTGAVLTLVIPVHAWAASTGASDVVIEAVRSRRRSGFGFLPIFGAFCCLVVVAAIVLGLVLISRNRKRRR